MKRKLFLTITVAFLGLSTNAQTYFPMPSSYGVWTYLHCYYDFYVHHGVEKIRKIGMIGDTTINTLNYKKIYLSDAYNFNQNNANYCCALRENNKQVFYISAGNTTENLLYDFNLNIGDTAKVYCLFNGIAMLNSLKVDSVDYVVINGQNHRRLKFNSNISLHPDEYWIEGIGSNLGLLFPLISISDNGFKLACLSIDNVLSYNSTNLSTSQCSPPSPPAYDCEGSAPTVITENSVEKIKEIVYPNPFSSSAILKLDFELKNATISIYNILGQGVKNINFTGQEIRIDRGNLTNGIYFVKIYDREKIYSTKIVIQ